jgi:hypothetical protein
MTSFPRDRLVQVEERVGHHGPRRLLGRIGALDGEALDDLPGALGRTPELGEVLGKARQEAIQLPRVRLAGEDELEAVRDARAGGGGLILLL